MTFSLRGLVITIGVCAAVLGVTIVPNLLARGRQSDAAIEREVLADVPLGSTVDAVEAYAAGRFRDVGRVDRGGVWEVFALYDSYLTLDLFPGGHSVRVVWRFDADQRLTEVAVQRTRYALK